MASLLALVLGACGFFGHIDPGSFSSGLLFTAILETGVV
ncbi:hypothetical protein SPAR86_1180 [Streptococcus pneumoniae GA44511]|nr:hypothetical protein SPAR86_1180 [Streptococcus pneumoniae GA44511]